MYGIEKQKCHRGENGMDGIINVYKEKGFTSHDVVAKLRGILHQKKIGHTGTLDPEAVGVLPVCLGKATKVCDLLTNKDKTYQAVCRLGVSTDTQDMTGEILKQGDFSGVTEEQLQGVLEGFLGDQLQIPPMYSALKVNGKKLYELAREGKTVERKPRSIRIHSIDLIEYRQKEGLFTMEVTCSKGTYIRTLCHDIGEKLGCFGAMESLQRTRVGVFSIEDALTLEQIEALMRQKELEQQILSVDALFPEYPAFQIRDEFAAKLSNGNPLLAVFLQDRPGKEGQISLRKMPQGQEFLVYDENGCFKAVYQKGDRDLRVRKMF